MAQYGLPASRDYVVLLKTIETEGMVARFRALHIRAHMGFTTKTGTLMFRNYYGDARQTYLVSEFAPDTWDWFGLESAIGIESSGDAG